MSDRPLIVVDSSSGLDPGQALALGIKVVPLRVTVGGADLRDVFDVSPAEVYRAIREGTPCTTAAPTVGEYVSAFDAAGGPVVCLAVGSRLSTLHQTAVVAAEQCSNRQVEVVDTGTAASAVGLLATNAARAAAEGLRGDEVAARVRRLAASSEMTAMVASVDHLARTGRVPDIASWGASVLQVKPLVRFRGGSASLYRLVRTARVGVRELRVLARDHAFGAGEPAGRGAMLNVFHAAAEDTAELLFTALREDLPEAEASLSEATAAMGVHLGPGVVGFAILAPVAALHAADAA
jgi:fatty acid kinase fatty acid binding subunit